MLNAFLVTFAYWFLKLVDNVTGYQTLQRPILLGTFTGLLLGDMKTGIILGALLEGVYMGISGIGGVTASDQFTGTILATAYAIIGGLSIEEAMAISVLIGTLMNSYNNLDKFCKNLFYPFKARAIEEGNTKKFKRVIWIQALFFEHEFACILIFLAVLWGTDAVSGIMSVLPAWLLNGLTFSTKVLGAVGFAMIALSIWSPQTAIYVLVGYILYKFVGLSAIPIAILGLAIAVATFYSEYSVQRLKGKTEEIQETGGDDLYE